MCTTRPQWVNLLGHVMSICISEQSHYWFSLWLVTCFPPKPLSEPMVTYHQINPRLHISVKFHLNSNIFIQENVLEIVVCKMSDILFNVHASICHHTKACDEYIDGFVQERRKSSALAMELRLSLALTHRCTKWSLIQVTACRLPSTKPLSEPMITFCSAFKVLRISYIPQTFLLLTAAHLPGDPPNMKVPVWEPVYLVHAFSCIHRWAVSINSGYKWLPCRKWPA